MQRTLCNYITLSLCAAIYSTFLTNVQFLNAVFFFFVCFSEETLRRPQSRHLEVKERLALVFCAPSFKTERHIYYIFCYEKKNTIISDVKRPYVLSKQELYTVLMKCTL